MTFRGEYTRKIFQIPAQKEPEIAMTDEQEEFRYKVVVCGEPAVGKTSLVKAFVEKSFREDYLPTIGVSILIKHLTLDVDGATASFTLSLWDIAGQQKFTQMRPNYYYGAKGAFLVGDLTRPETFEKLVEWHADLRKYAEGDVPVVLLANKSDLERAVDSSVVEEIGAKVGAVDVFDTSAKLGDNVKRAFETLTRRIHSSS
ncbi:MAG: Rab family GTPase [Promethearchaeota archaeon]